MKKLFPLAFILLISCSPNNNPVPQNPQNPQNPQTPSNIDLVATFTYHMDGQSFTCNETNRFYSDWIEGSFPNDTFDRALKLGVTHAAQNSMSIEFGVPVLRQGFSFASISSCKIGSPANALKYREHMIFAYSIRKGDTLWMSNNDKEYPIAYSSINYSSIQDIGDITDSVMVGNGPLTSNYASGIFDVYKAEGTWIDSVEGLIQSPGEPEGFMQSSGVRKAITGTFSFTFLMKQ